MIIENLLFRIRLGAEQPAGNGESLFKEMDMQKNTNADFVIIGAGIIGLTMALELIKRFPEAKIIVVEKEKSIGLHASGRNSGVVHSGIYYHENSWKARVCAEGAALMKAYCKENHLPIRDIGKIIIPTGKNDGTAFDTLLSRAHKNGVKAESIDSQRLKQLEPMASSAIEKAIFIPETAVIEPKTVLSHLEQELKKMGVFFQFGSQFQSINTQTKTIFFENQQISYGHLYNAAGLYADKVAHQCGAGKQYTMLPFKGMYYKLSPEKQDNINHLIYPVPDMNVPFLGVHYTKNIEGTVYLGPNAVPVFGRENYTGFNNVHLTESVRNFWILARQYAGNINGFRAYAHQEIPRFWKSNFVKAVKKLTPEIQAEDILPCSKAGIRAQLYDNEKKELVMDFLIEKGQNETHILNAVSPAFTCSFSLAKELAVA